VPPSVLSAAPCETGEPRAVILSVSEGSRAIWSTIPTRSFA